MEEDNFMNDTFIVFDKWSGQVLGVYDEMVDALDRVDELKPGIDAYVEAYIMNMDVDYDTEEDKEENLVETD